MGWSGSEGGDHGGKVGRFVAVAAMFDGEVVGRVAMLAGAAESGGEAGAGAGGEQGSDALPAGEVYDDVEAFAAEGGDAGPGAGEAEDDDFFDGGEEFGGG